MSHCRMLRCLGQCRLGKVDLLVAGGAAEVLPVSLNCPLPLRRTHPPTLVCCFCVFAAMGVTSTKSGRLEVNRSLSGKRGGKSHLGTIILSAVSAIWRFCMVIRSLLPISLEARQDKHSYGCVCVCLRACAHHLCCVSRNMHVFACFSACWRTIRMCVA